MVAVVVAFFALAAFPTCRGMYHRQAGRSASSGESAPVPVDFCVFLGSEGDSDASPVAPLASVNIGGEDNTTGFYPLCKDQCMTSTVRDGNVSFPQMRFCPCVAKLLVEDLVHDFGALAPTEQPIFTLGNYSEFDAGQDLFMIEDGHATLKMLMDTGAGSPCVRQPGRMIVWVAQHIMGHSANTELAGTTYLDQILLTDQPGAGVLLTGSISRSERRLSHETGHVVGFHHVAGQPVEYKYVHPGCPAIEWKMMERPSCEMNIMGSWYDGPYCCPFAGQGGSLLRLRSQFLAKREQCHPNSAERPKSPFCCSDECTYKCPSVMPAVTFGTDEQGDILSRILACWLHLRSSSAADLGLLETPSLRSEKHGARRVVECTDYVEGIGPCTTM